MGAPETDGGAGDPARAGGDARQKEDGRASRPPDAPRAPVARAGRPSPRADAPFHAGASPREGGRREEGPIEEKGRAAPLDAARDLVQQQFGPRAKGYVESRYHVRGESLDRLIECVEPEAHWRALDVATGGGHTALALSSLVREVVAADITSEMLEAAERYVREKGAGNITFCEGDAMNLPFHAGEFDLVTCRVAPHHFPDCGRFVSETARVLRPGGVAAMIDNVVPDDATAAKYINDLERLRDPSHHWAYPRGEWVALFEGAGFRVDRAELFRKERDFDTWSAMMGVTEPLRSKLRGLLVTAPGAAGEALSPEADGERLRFHLTEVLIVARRPG